MKHVLLSLLVIVILSACGGGYRTAHEYMTSDEYYPADSYLKGLGNLELCRNHKNTSRDYKGLIKGYSNEIRRRNIDCSAMFAAIEKQKKEQEELRISNLEKEHGFYCEWVEWNTRGSREFLDCLENRNQKSNTRTASNSSTGIDSSISDPTIAKYQYECQEMGFKKKTDKMAECILRQKEIETRKVAAKKLYDEEVRKNKAAEELAAKKRRSEKMRQAGELLTGISNSLLGSGSSSSYSSSSSSSQIKTPCMFKDEVQKNGSLTKLCLYDCTGSVHSETINVVQMCPLISYK
tara:strand:- start:107 stop:985 length:879 start_codon:yes stop_codon:yes gene_type:complete